NQNRVKHGGKTRNSSGDAGQWTLYAVAGLVLEDRQAKRLILLDVLIGTNGHVVRVRPQGLHDMGDHGPAAEGKQAFISIAHAPPLAASQNERPNMTWAGAPALGGLLVALFGLHPDFRAIGEALLLPERRLGLEVIHDEDVSLVGILPMRAGRLHNDDIFTNVDAADPVHDLRFLQGPALASQVDNAGDFGFGDARKVFQHQMRN